MYKITKPIRLIELFAGIGTQALALKDLGVSFEYWKTVEFDKFAVKSLNAIHGQNIVPTDIRDVKGSDLNIVDTDKYEYILSATAPCTSISQAGKQQGMVKGSGTASSLLWEVERLLNETENLPQIIFFENVSQVHSKKNMPYFQAWLDFLSSKGYRNYWQDLNAKDYGIPQNRLRTFMISILNSDEPYVFPDPIPLTTVMADFLEDEVPEKYYVKGDKVDALIETLISSGKLPENPNK